MFKINTDPKLVTLYVYRKDYMLQTNVRRRDYMHDVMMGQANLCAALLDACCFTNVLPKNARNPTLVAAVADTPDGPTVARLRFYI